MASEGFHEPLELLDDVHLDYHRAVTSLCEELEAIDWYHQRVKAASDSGLATILAYNRDDEKEHASMLLEWLRRRDASLDTQLRKFLFTSDLITEIGDATEDSDETGSGERASTNPSGSLGIGSMKEMER